jgi:hypothetical protein
VNHFSESKGEKSERGDDADHSNGGNIATQPAANSSAAYTSAPAADETVMILGHDWEEAAVR